MKTYPSYDALAIDLDLHFFDKTEVLNQAGNHLENNSWLVVTDDGQCHLFDKDGNLDNIRKLHVIKKQCIRKDIKKIIIPDSVKSIKEDAFFNYDILKSITISNAVKIIGEWAFGFCNSLTNIIIPDSVKSIGRGAFGGCSSLMNVVIPDSMKSIGNKAFYKCNNLTNMTMPKSINYIGCYAFSYCRNLKSLFFKGKTLKQVKAMKYYPWGIEDKNIIKAELE